jgi:PRTRC genetic system protein A
MMLPRLINHHIYTGQPLPEPWPYDYVLDGWGVVKRASTPHLEAQLRVAAGRVAGLPPMTTGIDLAVPRIPASWLRRVLAHARAAGPVEQMYHFHWLDNRWQVSLPRQSGTPGQVQYRGGGEASVVLDLHSHHGMPAFFSGTDNRDEQGCRFYAVIGRIFTARPELILRLGMYGDFINLSPLALFEGPGDFNTEE